MKCANSMRVVKMKPKSRTFVASTIQMFLANSRTSGVLRSAYELTSVVSRVQVLASKRYSLQPAKNGKSRVEKRGVLASTAETFSDHHSQAQENNVIVNSAASSNAQ
jgi:hypothetical protein